MSKQLQWLPDGLGGYMIKRNKKTISFGCGAVRVDRADLELLVNNPDVVLIYNKLFRKLDRGANYRISSSLSRITPETLKKILG